MTNVPKIITDHAYSAYQSQLEKEVKAGAMPQHLAIIMDGNRRYAKESGKDIEMGHLLGRDKLEEVLFWCVDLDIRNLTVYAFSTENFNRDEAEVDYLMEMMKGALYDFADDSRVHQHKLCLRILGDREMLSDDLAKAADYALEKTSSYTERSLNMAIAYGGRQDIINAVKEIVQEVVDGKMSVDDIDEHCISRYVSTSGLPDPDLVLRTSGEVRISNFLLWQMAYSELYFTDVFWPEFRYIDLLRAIRAYQARRRRYGTRSDEV